MISAIEIMMIAIEFVVKQGHSTKLFSRKKIYNNV